MISTLHVALVLPTKLDQETNHGVPGTGRYVSNGGASSEASARNQGAP